MLKRLFEVFLIWPIVLILIPVIIVVATINYIITGRNMLLSIKARKWKTSELKKELKNQVN